MTLYQKGSEITESISPNETSIEQESFDIYLQALQYWIF
jgi:hypothetical protein